MGKNGGRPTCSSSFFPSDHDHFLLEPRKGLEGLGQAGGEMASAVWEMNCLDYEDHLWKLSCHCLCSEANDVPHYLWKKHLRSWVNHPCGFFCVAERGSDCSGKVSRALTPTKANKRYFVDAEYASLKKWKEKFWLAGCKYPFWWLFISCFYLAGWHQSIYPGFSQAASMGVP